MKFIHAGYGKVINVNRVRYFRVDDKNRVWAIFGSFARSDGIPVERDEICLCTSDSRDEAEKYLALLVDNLNAEETS